MDIEHSTGERSILSKVRHSIPVYRRAVDSLAGIAGSAISVAVFLVAVAAAPSAAPVRVFDLAVVSLLLVVVACKMRLLVLIRANQRTLEILSSGCGGHGPWMG